MIYKTPSSKPGHVRVMFELPAATWADHIFLVGDFNDWNPLATPFIQDRGGVWWAMVDLPAGTRHEFRYLMNRCWHTDFHADGWSESTYGLQNSVVEATLPLLISPEQARPALGRLTRNAPIDSGKETIIGSIILSSRRPNLAEKTYQTKLLQESSIHETFTPRVNTILAHSA